MQLYILIFYDDTRLEDEQDRSEHVACVIPVGENAYNRSCVDVIYFLHIALLHFSSSACNHYTQFTSNNASTAQNPSLRNLKRCTKCNEYRKPLRSTKIDATVALNLHSCSTSSDHAQCVTTYCHDLQYASSVFNTERNSLPSQGSANYSGRFYAFKSVNLEASFLFDTYTAYFQARRAFFTRNYCIYCHTKGQNPKS